MKTRIFSIAIAAVMVFGIASNADAARVKSHRHASSLENVMDPSNDLQNWMTSDLVWNQGEFANYSVASDGSLAMESWMTNTFNWEWYPVATDETLEMESWMTTTMTWQMMPVAQDDELVIEEWMTSDGYWNMQSMECPEFVGADTAYSAYISENNK